MMHLVRDNTLWEDFKASYDRFQATPSEENKRLMKAALRAWENAFLGGKR